MPVMSCSASCCPWRAVVMKARLPPLPAKTMSHGSSPTRSVRFTRERVTSAGSISTMLMLSERWFTTQTSVLPAPLVRAATATGSRPTGISCTRVTPEGPTEKIERRLSGVFTA